LDLLYPPRLAPEPALAQEVGGQRPLELAVVDGELRLRELRIDRLDQGGFEREPEERVWAQRHRVGSVPDGRELGATEQLDRNQSTVVLEVQARELGEPRQVRHHQDPLVRQLADEGQDLAVVRIDELDASTSERRMSLAQR